MYDPLKICFASTPMNNINPTKEINSPNNLKQLNGWFLKTNNVNKQVNIGIVPISVDATTLSTYSSLQLIRLNGIRLPKSATIRILKKFFCKFLKIILQNISKNKDATRSLQKVNKLGGIDSTLILINKKELPQIADKPNKPKTGMLIDRFFRLHSVT